MAGRNYIPVSGLRLRHDDHRVDDPLIVHPHRRLASTELHQLEDRIASQSREIQTLIHDNQRLASSHVSLKQDVVAAQQDLRHLSDTAASVKTERDAQVREVYERSLKLEAEARSIDGLAADLDRVRADINDLRAERKELSEKLKDMEGELAMTRSEEQELSDLRTEIELYQREIRRGRAAVEYERKMRSKNSELNEEMEKHLISLAREAEKLRSELANIEKRVMVPVVAAVSAANPGPGYAIHQGIQPGYVGNSLADPHAVHQQGAFDASSANYSSGGGPQALPGPSDIQTSQLHG